MKISEKINSDMMDRAISKIQRSLAIQKDAAVVAMEARSMVAHALAEVSKAEQRNEFLKSPKAFGSTTGALDVTGFSAELLSTVNRLAVVKPVGNKYILRPKFQTVHLTEEATQAMLGYIAAKSGKLDGVASLDGEIAKKANEVLGKTEIAAAPAKARKAKVSVK